MGHSVVGRTEGTTSDFRCNRLSVLNSDGWSRNACIPHRGDATEALSRLYRSSQKAAPRIAKLAVPKSTKFRPLNKSDFYRYCRLIHAWLSAFAFIALCLFAFTGMLLNHPEWFSGSPAHVDKYNFELTADEVAKLRSSQTSSRTLIDIASSHIQLKGNLEARDEDEAAVGNEVFARMQGIRGTSYLRADLRSSSLEVSIESSGAMSMLNELHRAERAGPIWRFAVDALAVVLIAMSIIGYLIFLGMPGRRVRTAVVLTLGSTVALGLIFLLAVR